MKPMKKSGHITAFYVETLLLIVVFIAIILLLTQVFGLARRQSADARELTDAVALASNAAEALEAAGSPEELLALLDEAGNAVLYDPADHPDLTGTLPQPEGEDSAGEGPAASPTALITARFGEDHAPDPKGVYEVRVAWTPEASGTGTLVRGTIEVFEGMNGADTAPVYTLETASFKPEVTP